MSIQAERSRSVNFDRLYGKPDFYTGCPPLQPKREIAEYVEAQGILVPHRFAGLDDAVASGVPFIVRSEHPQDYAEASGLLASYTISADRIAEAKAKVGILQEIDWSNFLRTSELEVASNARAQVIAQIGNVTQENFESNLKKLSFREIRQYCWLTGVDPSIFTSKISYSYWEALPGLNRAIVADSALPGRYHLFTAGLNSSGEKGDGYAIIEDGEIVADSRYGLSGDIWDDQEALLQTYEAVKGLERFSKAHCPILEIQSVGGEHYFLQYHRTRDTQPATFSLDRDRRDGELEATFVRGATGKNGIFVRANIYNSYLMGAKRHKIAPYEDAAFDIHYDYTFIELMARQRGVQFLRSDGIEDITGRHIERSRLFKPRVTIALSLNDADTIVGDLDNVKDSVPTTKLWVVSDGRKAFVRKAKESS